MNIAILSKDMIDKIEREEDVQLKHFNALVDTGATSTCITNKVATDVGLTPIGKVPINGISGQKFHNSYLFYVGFTIQIPDPANSQGQRVAAHIQNKAIEGAELIASDGSFDVLLGMDIISTGSLAVEGSGTYSFSF